MALILDYYSKYDFIVNEVSKFGKYGYSVLTILDYIKTDCVYGFNG